MVDPSSPQWRLTAESASRMTAHGRAVQQRLFRIVQALQADDRALAERYVQEGVPLDQPLIFDETNGGVPRATVLHDRALRDGVSADSDEPPPEPTKNGPAPAPLTALGLMALHNRTEDINWLLEQGASVGMVCRGGRDAAWVALEHARHEAAQFLMSQGAAPDLRLIDGTGQTRLMAAVRCRAEWCVRLVLEHPDIDVNSRDRQGKTALRHNFDQQPRTEDDRIIAEILLERGADPNLDDNDGLPAHEVLQDPDYKRALLSNHRLRMATADVLQKIEANKPRDPDQFDPATDPGLPQIKNPRPKMPRLRM